MDTKCYICGSTTLGDNPPAADGCELCYELHNIAYRIVRRENKIADALLRNNADMMQMGEIAETIRRKINRVKYMLDHQEGSK